MHSHQKLHQALLVEWSSRIADQKASGLSIRQWCDQNNVSFHKYNYWKHQLKETLVDQVIPDIVPLSLPATHLHDTALPDAIRANRTNCTMVNLSLNGIDISLDSSVPESFLISLIKAVRYA